MSGEIDIIPGWDWLTGQPVTAAALDQTGQGMTATVRANSIGARELNALAVADIAKSVVGGYRKTVKSISPHTVAAGASTTLGPFVVTGTTTSMVVVPVGLVLEQVLVGGYISAANTLYLIARNLGIGNKAIPVGTSFTVVVV